MEFGEGVLAGSGRPGKHHTPQPTPHPQTLCMAPSPAGADSHPHAFTHLFSLVQISFSPGISSEPCKAVFSLRPTDQKSESPRPVPLHSSHLCHLLPELHGLTQPGPPLG